MHVKPYTYTQEVELFCERVEREEMHLLGDNLKLNKNNNIYFTKN